MSNLKNLPISLKIADEFLASFEKDPAVMAAAARALMDEVKRARQVLTDGYNRKELTVCNGKLGYVDPKDAARFLSDEIPRLTIYRKKKSAHNMALFYPKPPRFYLENQAKAKPARKGVKR
jgi:hypothetical protein